MGMLKEAEALTFVLARLKAVDRCDVGCGDDGDGYMYDYQDVRPDGQWIAASDVDEIIEQAENHITDAERPVAGPSEAPEG
jgi:hypothetical protein